MSGIQKLESEPTDEELVAYLRGAAAAHVEFCTEVGCSFISDLTHAASRLEFLSKHAKAIN